MDKEELWDEIMRVSERLINLQCLSFARDVVQIEVCNCRPCSRPCRLAARKWRETYLNVWKECVKLN